MNRSSPVAYFAIFILVSKVEHLVNILLLHRHRQVPHHELEVSLAEELVFYLVLLSPEVCWVGICSTYDLS